MTKFKNKYRIESNRLKNWDYGSNAMYFVTICTKDRECFFGNIIEDKMILSEIGNTAEKYWLKIPQHFSFVTLHNHIVMPNHVHGIIEIASTKGLSSVNKGWFIGYKSHVVIWNNRVVQ